MVDVRLFVAVTPPADVVAALDGAVGSRDEAMRWVPTEQWHLTLVFCGEITEAALPELTERLSRAAARTEPFTLGLAAAGTFPRQAARARVLWVGVTGEVPALTRLAERCAAAARRAGVDIEDRPFRPHLTLARARRDPVDARAFVERLEPFTSGAWLVRSFRLVHSTLGAKVRHETLAEPELSAGQGPR